MSGLLEKIRQSDVVVYATPLYVFTVSGLMKDFMDRATPLFDPHIIKKGNKYLKPNRYSDDKIKKHVLISTSGLVNRHNFSGLMETFRIFTSQHERDLAVILCGAGELLKLPETQESVHWYLDAARHAGREFVEEGSIKPETQEILDRNLIEPEILSQMVNAHWDRVGSSN